jgi:hypothetical protein
MGKTRLGEYSQLPSAASIELSYQLLRGGQPHSLNQLQLAQHQHEILIQSLIPAFIARLVHLLVCLRIGRGTVVLACQRLASW